MAPPPPSPPPASRMLSLQERFRAMVPSPAAAASEVVRAYKEVLRELTFNSKPVINELSMIAGEHATGAAAEGIAEAVCSRIAEVPVDQKLPSLYLLDSIVKNIRGDYVRHFTTRLFKVFCGAYNDMSSSQYRAMRHLFRTWWEVFPVVLLQKIEDELNFSPSTREHVSSRTSNVQTDSLSPRPHHGIHVNPKYLGTRQTKDSPADDQHGYSQGSSVLSDAEPNDRCGISKSRSPQRANTISSSKTNVLRSTSPPFRRSRSPLVDIFPKVTPGDRAVDRLAPSQLVSGYGSDRSTSQNGLLGRKMGLDDASRSSHATLLKSYDSGSRKHAKELIDAYGRSNKDPYEGRFSKLQKLETNGITTDSGARDWRSSVDEEYAWEDMSPTLADRSRRNITSLLSGESFTKGMEYAGSRTELLPNLNAGRSNWQSVGVQLTNHPAASPEDKVPAINSGDILTNRKFTENFGTQNNSVSHYQSTHYAQDALRSSQALPHSWQDNVPAARLLAHQSNSGISKNPLPSAGDPINMNTSVADLPIAPRLQLVAPTPGSHMAGAASLHTNHSQPLPPVMPDPRLIRYTGEAGPVRPHGSNLSSFLPHHPYGVMPPRPLGNNPPAQSMLQQAELPHMPQKGFGARSQPNEFFRNTLPQMPLAPNHLQEPGHGVNPIPLQSSSSTLPFSAVQAYNMASLHQGGVMRPPLPPGPPPAPLKIAGSQYVGPVIPNTTSGPFSGILSTLMAQGVISLNPSSQPQESMGLEFNADLLKVRHESAIKALYTDLPRQCTTCGLRFKNQEEHSSHMDWHVAKNRNSKNRKQKPSRKWFVSAKEWLSGAEILGVDVVPGFLPAEVVAEKKEVNELAVPADQDQTACALCGEAFEEFYSDESEEWMYKGTIYLKAPDGNFVGLERSQLGPIVHAKCRTESGDASKPA